MCCTFTLRKNVGKTVPILSSFKNTLILSYVTNRLKLLPQGGQRRQEQQPNPRKLPFCFPLEYSRGKQTVPVFFSLAVMAKSFNFIHTNRICHISGSWQCAHFNNTTYSFYSGLSRSRGVSNASSLVTQLMLISQFNHTHTHTHMG